MTKKLRLLVTKRCNRRCKGCCNKDWDLNTLPTYNLTDRYDEIYITGGEPLLNDRATFALANLLKTIHPTTKLYFYTAIPDMHVIDKLLLIFDGVTLTFHTQKDSNNFDKTIKMYRDYKSYRLNVFKGIKLLFKEALFHWKIKDNIEWIKDAPLPENEEFKKLLLF